MSVEKFSFQAEINQLLNLIIHTFYSQKEVFVRELISNASDALDKYNHYALINKPSEKVEAKIDIIQDKENKIIRFIDTGIGMTRQELIDNIGTIAQSGTKKFMENVKDSKLIGSYGVGFFSSYIVSSNVSIITKHPEDGFYKWNSDASGEFTIEKIENGKITDEYELKQGTCIECVLKDDNTSFLEVNKVKEIVKKHSQYINYPINIFIIREETKEVPDDSPEEVDETKVEKEINENTEVIIEDVDESKEKEEKPPKMKKITETIKEFEQINSTKPVWTKNASEITEEEFKGLYKSLTNDNEEPYGYKAICGEGQVEYKGILYLPKKIKNNVFERGVKQNNIKLYVKKVFVTDDSQSISPEWLHFVTGIIDTDDLPLNVSREMLQENKIIKILKKAIIKKSIDMLHSIMIEDKEKYSKIFTTYQKNIKLGVYEESGDRERIADLLMFYSMKNPKKMISLDDYITEMHETQDKIYFITGDDIEIMKASPFLEKFNQNNIDVLFMTDPVDEYMCQRLQNYKEKKLTCITKGNIEIPNESQEDKDELKKIEEEYKEFCEFIKKTYKSEFTDVKISNKAVESPCIISSPEHGFTANMERIVKAQTLGQKDNNMSHMMNKRILEINYKHKVIEKIKSIYKEKEKRAIDLLDLIINSALLYCGYSLNKPIDFSKKLVRIVMAGLDLDDEEYEKDENNKEEKKEENNKEENNKEEKKEENNKEKTKEIEKEIIKESNRSPLETTIETINVSDMASQD
jgi:molecular chaperone HtpG